jgi:hypothetical protein
MFVLDTNTVIESCEVSDCEGRWRGENQHQSRRVKGVPTRRDGR